MSKYWTKVLRSECPELGAESTCSTLTLLPKSLLTETHWNCLLQSRPAVQCTVSVHCTVLSEGNTLTHISPPPSTLSTLDNSPDSSVCHSLELQPLTNFDYLIFNQLNSRNGSRSSKLYKLLCVWEPQRRSYDTNESSKALACTVRVSITWRQSGGRGGLVLVQSVNIFNTFYQWAVWLVWWTHVGYFLQKTTSSWKYTAHHHVSLWHTSLPTRILVLLL